MKALLRFGALTALLTLPFMAGAAKSTAPKDASRQEDQPSPAAQLEAARKQLAEMLVRYTERHPAVIEQRKKIAALEAQLAKQKR